MTVSNRTSALLLFVLLLAGVYCGAGSKKEEDGGSKKTEYKIDCKGDQAVREEIFDGFTLREGPVEIPAGSSCKKIASRTGSAAKKLKRTGVWVNYFRGSRQVVGRGPYRDDVRSGEWEFFNKDGQRTRVSVYADDQKNGPETNYFPGQGEWKSKGPYAADKKDGPWQIKLTASASCVSAGSYSADVKQGEWKDCALSKAGKAFLQFQGAYVDGMRDGDATIFHQNGKPLAQGRLRADRACAAEPPGGDLDLCSKRSGAWEIFHPNGKLAWKGSYDGEGKKTGTWTEYYQTGKLLARGERSSGKRTGTWQYYAKDGSLFGEFRFRKSEFLLEYATLYEKGRKTGSGPLKNALLKYDTAKDEIVLSNAKKAGRWVEYHPNGQKAAEGEYSFGSRKGPWTLYDASGRKIAEGPYSFNKKHGVWKELQGGTWKTIEYRLGTPK